MHGYIFGVAAANHYVDLENGHGFAIKDQNDRFFCGFRQENGVLAFSQFRQRDGSISAQHRGGFDCKDPLFLSLAEMRDQNIAAAVFATAPQVNLENSLPPEIARECMSVYVRKDMTHRAPAAPVKSLDEVPVSKPGLASASACQVGNTHGYISLAKAFEVRTAKWCAMAQRVLGL